MDVIHDWEDARHPEHEPRVIREMEYRRTHRPSKAHTLTVTALWLALAAVVLVFIPLGIFIAVPVGLAALVVGFVALIAYATDHRDR